MAGMYGTFNFPTLPYSKFEAGVDLGNALVLATGGNVVYLRSTGPADYDPAALSGRIVTTLSAALSQCRANKADTILVLPGHSEDVTSATALSGLVAGTRIIGIGQGSDMPKFTWKTATAANWAINKANVCISGLRLDFTGVTAVTSAITVTGADCSISGCDIIVGVAAAIPVIGITVSTGADRFQLTSNRLRGVHATGITDSVVKVAAAVDGACVLGNSVYASATGNGVFAVTAAATNLEFGWNVICNTQTASSRGIHFADVAATGICHDNRSFQRLAGSAAALGITFATTTPIIGCAENYNTDEKQLSGLLNPAAAS